jgi:hypothetical protein
MRHDRQAERGQILPLFTLAMTAMILMAALLFGAANALVVRRELQSASDAAAMAGVNTLLASSVNGCSASGTTPRTSVRDAALAALSANHGNLDIDNVDVTCPSGYGNAAVRVTLDAGSPAYFMDRLAVSASATALNGQVNSMRHSLFVLNPYNSAWNKQQGCPSTLLSGGPTLILEGTIQVNSACPAGEGGALATNGNSATLSFLNGSNALLVGGYSPGALVINPTPKTGQPYIQDPLKSLPPPPSTLALRSSSRLVLNNTSMVLDPGIYRGGIQLKNSSQAFMKPGIYVIDGGGFDLGAQASLFSVDSSKSSTSYANWSNDCTTSCGVMIYNTGTKTSIDSINVSAGATLALRPYQLGISSPDVPAYLNLLVWQSGTPLPASNYSQPPVEIGGGGQVEMSGTIYAPSAKLYMRGGAGGSGGDSLDVTVQFVVWEAQFQGNTNFNFLYRSEEFAKPYGYGLVE